MKKIASGLGVPPAALARLWAKSPPEDSWFVEGEDGNEAWSLTPPREPGDYVVGLKNIKDALGVKQERTVARWLERNPQWRRLLKPRGRYRITRGMLDNVWLFMQQSAHRGKHKGAANKRRNAAGSFK